jgi:hypothetical protein
MGQRAERGGLYLARIATTASPVSGADVRDRMQYLALRSEFARAVHVIRSALRHVSVARAVQAKSSLPTD